MARKAKLPITTVDRVRVVDTILPLLYQDIRGSLRIRSVMHAANKVRSPLFEGETHVADPLMVTLNCIHIRFAFDLARIYDVSQTHPLDEQQKASIPILLHHLSHLDVQDVLVERSRGPVPEAAESEAHAARCRAALEKVMLMPGIMKSAEMAEALDRIRHFRNRDLPITSTIGSPTPRPSTKPVPAGKHGSRVHRGRRLPHKRADP
jgi:hypothetical protein